MVTPFSFCATSEIFGETTFLFQTEISAGSWFDKQNSGESLQAASEAVTLSPVQKIWGWIEHGNGVSDKPSYRL